jgi:hypothetical protein
MGVRLEHDILFNFAASPVGAGLKRLYEYARWFDAHGGARFIIHPRCESLQQEFNRNEFVVARQSSASRILRGVQAVRDVQRTVGTPDCYYAFGIPLHGRVGRVNWCHVSNVLTLAWRTVPLPLSMRLKFRILGRQTVSGLPYADVISAESNWALALFDPVYRDRLCKSVNGSDDELTEANHAVTEARQPIAVVVGTYPYKALDESCRVFDELRRTENRLTLHVFGDETLVAPGIRARTDVVVKGNRPRSEVIAELRRAKYYISTTLIENSYNAACEGIFFADESYISDIGPHRELVEGLRHQRVMLDGTIRPLIHALRSDLTTANLKSWAEVITDMNQRIDRAMRSLPAVQSSPDGPSIHV